MRELLNYGHTLGHAFEAAGDYEALLHGEAVSVGMVAAAAIGERVGLTPPALVERQNRLLERAEVSRSVAMQLTGTRPSPSTGAAPSSPRGTSGRESRSSLRLADSHAAG